ncbi:MAG: flagellar biosynthesis anti-sigma factor FlgM [Desulfobacterales bacterium]|jgi:negative regulator of flagellin synthesis FlgM|nr:flagellar biosynthesis anti-sigma factor FlgM [Desulfobacterales bacterium]
MNNISNITQKYGHRTLLSETADKHRIDIRENQATDNNAGVSRDDKVSLSQASKEMQLAKTAVAKSPNVREERVAELKQAIASNQYSIDPDKIADSIIGAIISDIV